MERLSRNSLVIALVTVIETTLAQNNLPQNIPFNTSRSHGPDGPWNFITLNVGASPQSFIDFYPMFGSPASLFVDASSCDGNNDECITPLPGYYNVDSESAQEVNVNKTVEDVGQGLPFVVNLAGNGYNSVDTVNTAPTVENLTIFVSDNTTSYDNTKGYVPVSLLSLEPATNNATHLAGRGNAINPGQQTLLQAYTDNTDGSGTIGLHMGSASYDQPGSLYLGGYDQNRLIEPPAVFENVGSVNLSSISFGHAEGLDPWANSAKPAPNFLSQDMQVFFSPHIANMYLPQSLCNRFMQYLPITYDDETNLYLWNTSAPLYKSLMSSPSYMNFTFHDSASTSIKIPFALLNLTLTSPVKKTPTPYFPCQPRSDTTNLGRAFLQGAMYIQSYNPARIIVGQAPGPSVNGSASANVQTLDASNPVARQASSAPRWNDTWAAQLKPLSSAPAFTSTSTPSTSPNSASNSNSNNGLSGGAIAGIVIGVVVGVGLIAGALAFFLLRRRRATKATSGGLNANEAPDNGASGAYLEKKMVTSGVPVTPSPAYQSTAGSSNVVGSAPAFGGAQEMDGRGGDWLHEAGGNHVAEAPGHGVVAEMPDTSSRAEVGGVDTQR